MELFRFHTDENWEQELGCCRAIRLGNLIYVGSVAPVNSFGEVQGTNAYEQTQYVLHVIRNTLEQMVGGSPEILRTRIYIKNASNTKEITRAHREAFASSPPVSTLFEVKGLSREGVEVEIEAEAASV